VYAIKIVGRELGENDRTTKKGLTWCRVIP
jgi:hypothetical protein